MDSIFRHCQSIPLGKQTLRCKLTYVCLLLFLKGICCINQWRFFVTNRNRLNQLRLSAFIQACYMVFGRSPMRVDVEGQGVDSDFVLYVSAQNTTACSGTTAAHANHCQLERSLDRSCLFVVLGSILKTVNVWN